MENSNNFFQLVAEFQKNIDWLNQILKGGESDSAIVNGVVKPSISKDIEDKWQAIRAMVQGRVAYETKADLPSSPPQGVILAEVWRDPEVNNNGLYGFTDGKWEKSPYDIEQLAGEVVDSALRETNDYHTKTYRYVGDDEIIPIIVDSQDRALLYLNKRTGLLAGALSVLSSKQSKKLAKVFESEKSYIGSDQNIVPIVMDKAGRALIYYDLNDDMVKGPFNVSNIDRTALPIAYHNHLISYGQSLSMGAVGRPAISLIQPYSNVTFQGGVGAGVTGNEFGPLKPLVEDDNPTPGEQNKGETVCSGAANYYCQLRESAGHNPHGIKVLATAAGRGGYRIDQLEPGASWYNNLISHITQGNQLSSDYALHALLWEQGESDAGWGGNFTSYEVYKEKLKGIQTGVSQDYHRISGRENDVYVITYQMTYGSKTHPDVALAQLDLARNDPRFTISTPIYHLRYADGAHLKPDGYFLLGCYAGRAYKRLLEGETRVPINPISATHDGNTVKVQFEVMDSPLLIDKVNLNETQDSGFQVRVAGAPVPITDIQIGETGDVVNITTGITLSGVVEVRYALDYACSGLGAANGASGNLIDSNTEKVMVPSYGERDLFNICPHFKLTSKVS